MTMLLLSLLCGSGCNGRSTPIVLEESDRIFIVRDSKLMFGRSGTELEEYPFTEVEGWYVVAPGNLVGYLRWLAHDRAREKEAAVEEAKKED